jgi:O-antigen ligase
MIGWQELLTDFARSAGPENWLLGKPYGSGYERIVLGRLQEFSPHNYYVQLLLRLGSVGLLLFLWVHVALRQRMRAGVMSGLSAPVLHTVFLAVLTANLLFYIPYGAFYLQGAFYGVMIGYLATRSQPDAVTPGVQPALRLGEAK